MEADELQEGRLKPLVHGGSRDLRELQGWRHQRFPSAMSNEYFCNSLLCNTENAGLVLAALPQGDGEARADYEQDLFDVQNGIEVAARDKQLRGVPVPVKVKVFAAGIILSEHNATLCRQNYYDNTNALFNLLTEQQPFVNWDRVTYRRVLQQGESSFAVLYTKSCESSFAVLYTKSSFLASQAALYWSRKNAETACMEVLDEKMLDIVSPLGLAEMAMDGERDSVPEGSWEFNIYTRSH